MNAEEFSQANEIYEETGVPVICEKRNDNCGPLFLATKKLVVNEKEIHLYCGVHAPKGAVPIHPREIEIKMSTLLGEKGSPVASDAASAVSRGTAQLRSKLSAPYGIRLESTGARASAPITCIIFQTLDASPKNPYVVTFDQFILDSFTGAGQFDLVERDSGDDVDVLDAESGSPVTIATHSDGFTGGVDNKAGWSHFQKPITSDKIYSVVFVPGDTGDGAYSISARTLIPLDPDQTPLPS